MVDGKLDLVEARGLTEHLHECAECRATLADFEKNKALFRQIAAPPPPSDRFWDETFGKMRSEPIPDVQPELRFNPANARYRRAGLAAAACAVLAVAIPLNWSGSGTRPVTRPASANVADTLDSVDVTSFVRAHTQSAAAQPLGDPDRQQMIAADADTGSGDDVVPAVEYTDVSQ